MISIPGPLRRVLSLDGFSIFISGKRGSGKTNFAMLLMQICRDQKLRFVFASNVETIDEGISYVNNYPDLSEWGKREKGKKVYVFDEAGKHIKRLRFMSNQNVKIMEIVQLCRHYDMGLIAIAPTQRLIDSNYLDPDLLDILIKKAGNRGRQKKTAFCTDNYNELNYSIHDLPVTSINHNSKTDAIFTMERPTLTENLPFCCKVAGLYAQTKSYKITGDRLGLHSEQVKREVLRHLKHA